MIRVDLSAVTATARLSGDQHALANTSDVDGPACVIKRGSAGWATLRAQLWIAQHGKCAYCEDELREVANEVDHIRPRSRAHYWWLAFSLPNLLLACRTCNNRKSDHWELVPGAVQLAPRQEPWTTSEPAMLVDPTSDDPSAHITYEYAGSAWRIAPRSVRGRWTIDTLALDRDSFTNAANRWVAEAVDPRVDALAQRAKRTTDQRSSG